MNSTDIGSYFPIWATCLGFEMLHYIYSGFHYDTVIFDIADEHSVKRKMMYIEDARKDSKLFGTMSESLFDLSKNETLIYLNHEKCVND